MREVLSHGVQSVSDTHSSLTRDRVRLEVSIVEPVRLDGMLSNPLPRVGMSLNPRLVSRSD